MTGELCYVYAVGLCDEPLDEVAGSVTGQDGAAVRAVRAAGLGALVSTVSAGRFGEQGMKAQLEDMERLETVARAHDAVVAEACRRTTVLPMRLATVCTDDARVAGMLREHGGEFRTLLDGLTGQAEWGVKVHVDPREAGAGAAPAGPVVSAAAAGPGRAYLRERRARRRSLEQTYRTAGAVAEAVAEAAETLATAAVAHRPQQGELAAGPGENIANHAYLVPAGRAADFPAAVRRAAGEVPGVQVEVTGPWAPYSFAFAGQAHDG